MFSHSFYMSCIHSKYSTIKTGYYVSSLFNNVSFVNFALISFEQSKKYNNAFKGDAI